jgi:hypothetical protein
MLTGKFSGRGMWYLLGFEDHVFGQRRPDWAETKREERINLLVLGRSLPSTIPPSKSEWLYFAAAE